MQIGVLGAGAIGGCLAALLGDSGHDVEVTTRGRTLDAVRQRGLHLDGAFGITTTWPTANEALQRRPELAILATKAHDAAAALTASATALQDVPLLVVQNGLDGHRRAGEIVGHDRVAGGIVTWAANAMKPGRVTITAGGLTLIGGEAADVFIALLSPVLPDVQRVRSVAGAQWTKLVINMLNAVPAIVGWSVQSAIADPGLRVVIAHAMREAARAGHASGVSFEAVGAVTPEDVESIRAGSIATAEHLLQQMASSMGDVPNLGSTQQSLLRGQTTEVDALNQAVVTHALQAGFDAPVNRALVTMVREVERSGMPLPADRVRALVTR